MWAPSSISHKGSPHAQSGEPRRWCTIRHSLAKHHPGLAPRLPGAAALVPAQKAQRHGLELPPNFRMVEAGRDLRGPSGPTLLSSGAEPAAQDAG